nr:leucine-rich repeat domain-containing protein [Treponema sp.]
CYPKGKTGTSYSIPGSVTSIGDYAFYWCTSLTSINIPEGATSIGCSAFSSCTSLISINIPENVTSIGDHAFSSCSNLTSITFSDTSTWYITTSETNWINKTGGLELIMTDASTSTISFTSYYLYKL